MKILSSRNNYSTVQKYSIKEEVRGCAKVVFESYTTRLEGLKTSE